MYTCPSDFPFELEMPHSGPGNAIRFMPGSYRGNAGRGDGFVTWYLNEETAGKNDGWRGPLHAVVRKGGAGYASQPYVLEQESIEKITDGTSNTLLAAESTNVFARRRTFWAYSYGNSILSQTTPFAPTLYGDWCRCLPNGADTTSCPNVTSTSPSYGQSNRACMSGWFAGHTSAMNAAMCDGSVSTISFDIDLQPFCLMGGISDDGVF
jgi:prepilin-type processing-associated H-X9-DG protein